MTIRIGEDRELLELAVKSGLKGVLVGFETVSQQTLNSIRKGFNSANRFCNATKLLHDNDVAIMGCFVFGLDSDDKDCFKRTVDFVYEANIDIPRFTVNTAYPGPEHYEEMRPRLRYDKWWLGGQCRFAEGIRQRRTADHRLPGRTRISPGARHLKVLSNGFRAMRELMMDGRALTHFTTIVEDNRLAKIALTWKNKAGTIPNYVDWGLLKTYFIFPLIWKRRSQALDISHARMDELDDIVAFIDSNSRRRQFHPVYTRDFFLGLNGFHIEDFTVARREGRLVGVAALWDQTGFKQLLVNRYNGKMRVMKKIFGGFLPDEGEVIPNACLSFVAIQDDSADILQAILSHIYNDVRKSGLRYFMLCLHESAPLNAAVRLFPRLTYKSRLYIADYADDESVRSRIDGRIPHVEVATL
ncbi:MAG: hypothetical protein IJJ33_05175 [Victivallales bacterium]|nr:hypothetical protein [Victivallales bacterium]